jgi:hypothetical protein
MTPDLAIQDVTLRAVIVRVDAVRLESLLYEIFENGGFSCMTLTISDAVKRVAARARDAGYSLEEWVI